MHQGATAAAGARHWLERWTLEILRFLADFWLLLVFAAVLGIILVWVPQSQEVWRHYILSPPPPLLRSGWALLHTLFLVAGFLFAGIIFARYAQHKKQLRQDAGRRPVPWVVPAAALLPFVIALLGVWFAAWGYRDVGLVQAEMVLALAISSVLILLALVTVVILARGRGAAALADLIGSPRTSRLTLVAALALLAMFLLVPLLPAGAFIWTTLAVGAVPAMLFSIGLVLYAIDSAFRTTGYRKILAVGALGVAVLGILFGDLASAHRVRRAGDGFKREEFPQVRNEFKRWLETRKDLDRYDHYPVFIVAAQGGGIYAAQHTARVLAVLQDECPAFAQHVFAISGVSGGSLGSAVFASAVKSLKPEQTLEHCRRPGTSTEFLDYTDRFLKRDFLSPLGFLAVIPNIVQRVAGLPASVIGLAPRGRRMVRMMQDSTIWGAYDRALGLEYGFEDAWYDASRSSASVLNFFTRPSTSTWTGKDSVPALVLNTTRADTGVAYLVAPFRLDRETALDFRAKVLAVESPWADVRVSTAVALSARYPFATGPGMIEVEGPRWLRRNDAKYETIGLVDGGFVENSGLQTVGKLVREIHDFTAENKDTRKIAIYVLSIQDMSAFTYTHSGMDDVDEKGRHKFLSERIADLAPATDFEQPVRYGFAELTAPLLALDASRSARSFYTLTSFYENARTLQCAQGVPDKIRDLVDECDASGTSRSGELVLVPRTAASTVFGFTASNRPLPLGWHLSYLSRRRIEERAWVDPYKRLKVDAKTLDTPWDKDCYREAAWKLKEDDDEVKELREFGEDMGAYVDRRLYACGRIHVNKVLEKEHLSK